jgi:hypothetical protein
VITIVTYSISGITWFLKMALLAAVPYPATPVAAFALPPPFADVLTVGVIEIGLPYPVALSNGAPKISLALVL